MDAPDLLERTTFITRYGGSDSSNRVIRRLHTLISQPAAATMEGCVEWLDDLVGWLFERGRLPEHRAGESELEVRTRVLLEVFEEVSEARRHLQDAVTRLLTGTSATRLFTDTGLPTHLGFWRELFDRFANNTLPEPPVGSDLSRLVTRLFSARPVAQWFLNLPSVDRQRLATVTGLVGQAGTLAPAMRESVLLLATRIAMQGTADEMRRRLPGMEVVSSPFLKLVHDAEALLAGQAGLAQVEGTLFRCRGLLRQVEASLEDAGISVDLVFRVELLSELLTRFELVARLSFGTSDSAELAANQLERDVIRGAVRDRSLRALWLSSTRLLARRVVERAGHGGEHYITQSRSEQQAMLDSAAGGGAITAVAVMTKFVIGWVGLPILFNALAIGLNYATAFVAMQLSHFSLATKQPAMTAATLAGAIEAQGGDDSAELSPLVEQVARASRTQFAALLGNVGFVVPIALAVDTLIFALSGSHFLAVDGAEKVIAGHHVLHSGTLYFAAMTGVWLWLASLIAGGVENWFVLRELPGAIASHRGLRRVLGAQRAARFSRFMVENISGLGGNLGFGLLLGVMPMLFSLVGIPLEVRHVTFSMGQMIYAVTSLGPEALGRADVGIAFFTVLLVGLVNFGVSFALALVVALRARGLGARDGVELAREVWKRFRTAPGPFFLAPKDVPGNQLAPVDVVKG